MSFQDLLRIALGNLRRQKLRSILTISGVIIAIGAFVAMLSFGAGNQRLMSDQMNELGLFTTMLVYPASEGAEDSLAILDAEAVRALSRLPGVRLAYPFNRFQVEVSLADSLVRTQAQALPAGALQTKLFSQQVAGEVFREGETGGAVVTEELLEDFGIEDPDSILGRQVVVSVRSATADSGLARLFSDEDGEIRARILGIQRDSLLSEGYIESLIRRELGEGARRFFDGYLNAQALITDTLVVRGVLEDLRGRTSILPVIVPEATARRFDAAGPGGDPTQLVPQLMQGTLFEGGDASAKSYGQVTLDLDGLASHTALSDSVEAMGFSAFSYAAQFEEVRRMMIFFNMGLGLVGLVALVTAALGIANTMVMSIMERRREIGILRSLGAEAKDVRGLYLVESGTIGALGAAGGILLGWLVARVASMVAKAVMRNYEVEAMELFATPLWLVALALAFGVLVAVLAGSYPARRAARLDPVAALRQD